MISLLMPSRERPQLARKAIESFGNHKGFEFILAIDSNDSLIEEYDFAKTLITQQHGYEGLHHYFNKMAKLAKGKWLMLFNDDAVLESDPDSLYKSICSFSPSKPTVLNVYSESDNLFPIISRKFYDIIGHYSLSPHVDSWVQQIGEQTGTQVFIPNIKINHFRDTMSDETYRNSRRAVERTAPEYNSEAMIALRQIDIDKIRRYKDENNL